MVVLLAVAGGVGGWVLAPPVSDAQQRVQAFLAGQHANVLVGPVPAKYATALIATEDSRFYDHHGIDTMGIVRGAGGFIGGSEQGGSTLDQQLAKTLYSNGNRAPTDIVAQVILGAKLDASYPKAQILQMYAQVAYFGAGFYGLQDAACGYFNVAPQQLTWSQASLLAGLPQAPSAYNPLTGPGLAALRQRHVLDRLVATGALAQAEVDTITPDSWHLVTARAAPAAGCPRNGPVGGA